MKSNLELGRKAPARLPLALLFVLALPAAAAAQWTTTGTNTTTTNNVGVGTTSPVVIFQIRPAANVNMGFTHSGGVDAVITTFNDANTAIIPLMIRGSSIKFQDGTMTERMRIGAGVAFGAGYVGLTAPTNGAIFQGNVAFGTSTADRLFTVEGQVANTATPMAVFRTTGTANGSGLALDATGTGNNNLGFHVAGVRKAAISWDNSRNFLGLLNTAYSDNDFSLRLNNNGSLTFHDGANGTERLRITAAGNVGINTSTPGYPLTVRATLNNAPLNLQGGTGNIEIWKDTTPTKAVAFGSALPGVAAGDDIQLSTYNGTAWTSRLTVLNSNGNVGVGNTAPGYKLDVAGSVNASGLCLGGDCKTAWSQVGGSLWAANGTSAYYNGGNVGIGTSTPSQIFQVHSSGTYSGTRVTTAATGATLGDGVNFGYDDSVGAYVWNRETTPVVLSTSNAERMRIDAAGNVGIGTTNPIRGLHVAGANGTIAAEFVLENTGMPANYRKFNLWGSSTQGAAGRFYLRLLNDAGSNVTKDFLSFDNATGNVGVGTNAPAARLDVAGDVNVAGDITASGNISAKYQDVAEWVPSTQQLSAGTVVVLDAGKRNHVVASSSSYDTKVAGVVSDSPGVILGVGGEGKLKVATTGRVLVRVDATRAPIRVGDLLVTSDVEGVAMRSEPVAIGGRQFHAPGTIIGKALEPLESGTGEILVLLSLQ